MTLPIPDGPDALSAGWLSAVLSAPVREVNVTRIGENEGFMGGALYRLSLPNQTLVAKLSPAEAKMRTRLAAANAREVAFYTSWSDGLPVPGTRYAACDAQTGASVVLMEDLGAARAVPFINGLKEQDVCAVLKSLARIHAKWWGKPDVAKLSGVDALKDFVFADHWANYPPALRDLLPDMTLSRGFLTLGDYAAQHTTEVFSQMQERGPLTLLHRDLQMDNILFNPDGGALFIDWQFLGKGRGTWDVSYFLASSVQPALRRAQERHWIGAYHDMLLKKGVTGYAVDTCWQDYLKSVIAKLFVTVIATVELDNSTDHKRAYRRADLTRLLAFIEDHSLTPAIWEQTHD
jgi:hypothetical protein